MIKKSFGMLAAFLVALAIHFIWGPDLAPAAEQFNSKGIYAIPVGLGLIVNAANLNAIFTNLKTLFNKGIENADTTWKEIAMEVPSTGKQNDYSWLSKFPKMRKWVGDKVVKQLQAFKYTIENDDFEATVEVDRNDIDDDNLGIYKPQAEAAGQTASEWPDDLVYEVVNGAFANVCYDGQYFFDTDHPVGDGKGGINSVSNKLTAVLSNATLAAAQASFGAAKTMMGEFKDDEGRPLKVRPKVLLVGVALEDTANMLMKSDKLADNTPNPYKGMAKVVVSPLITSSTFWALLDTSKPIKPFIFQPRKKPVFVKQTDPESDEVFNRKMYKFGAEARGNSGYGLWQLAVGSDGTG